MVWIGRVWQGKAGFGEAWQGKDFSAGRKQTAENQTWHGEVRLGKVRHGLARWGLARHGERVFRGSLFLLYNPPLRGCNMVEALPQWEYMDVRIERIVTGYRVRWVNDLEVPDWRRKSYYVEFLNKVGEQGWELVGATSFAGALHPEHFLFKRPLSDFAYPLDWELMGD